jgi:hypothetical protein
MPALETLKKITEMATGLARPGKDQLGKLVRLRKAQTFRFKDDGNHPEPSLLASHNAVRRRLRSSRRLRGLVREQRLGRPLAERNYQFYWQREGWCSV